MSVQASIRILLLEDNPHDAELAIAQLISEGFRCDWDCVDTRDSFLARLAQRSYDIILADYQLPAFDGLTALKLLRRKDRDLPFILTSGRMGEEAAIECLKAGATDYVLKDHINRLGPVVQRALNEAEEKRKLARAQAALGESERRYRLLFEKANDAIFIIDATEPNAGRIIQANQAAAAMHGYTLDELLALNIRDLDAPNTAVLFKERVAKMLVGAWLVEEIEHRKKDGTIFPVEMSAGVIDVQDKRFILAFDRDISERRRQEAEAREFEKHYAQIQKMEALGTLAGGIAHDFNNILSPLIGYTELCMLDLPADSPLRQNMAKVLNAAERARELVQQILIFSRQGESRQQPVRISLIIKEVLKFLKSGLPSTIRIKPNLAAAESLVLADPVHIHQVVMNLCVNAFQAMQEKGGTLSIVLTEVDIAAQEPEVKDRLIPGAYVKMEVCDTGVGISRMEVDKIFDPYFTTKKEGTGLGLATVHSIINTLGGRITVQSTPGEGTTFTVYLPRERTGQDTRSVDPLPDVPTGKERILVVDDESTIVTLLQQMLTKLGYQATGYTSSRQAYEAFIQDPRAYDLILTDLTMPEMTGLDLARRILAAHPEVPIVLSTGFGDNISRERIREFGLRDLIMKPVIYKELGLSVRQALDWGRTKSKY